MMNCIRPSLLSVAALIALYCSPAQGEVDLAAQIVGARTWTNTDGKKIKAGLEGASRTVVTLRLPTGKTVEVEVAKLGAEDRAYVVNWLANNAMPAGFGKVDQTIVITAEKGNLKYDKSSFTVYPEKKIKLVLRNLDDMHHNLVICNRGKNTGTAVAEVALKLGGEGFANHWIPDHKGVLFASKMADPYSTATIYFTAPKKKGKYPFVCTLPGHAQIMKGTMVVSTEINPLSELTFTLFKGSWNKLPDFEKLKPAGTDHVESGKFDLSCTKDSENFGLVFNGQIAAPADGSYSFTIGSDDGSRLLIDRKVVIDHDGIHGMKSKSGKVKLSKGLHDIEVQYFEKSGEEALYVGWKPPGVKKEQALSIGGVRSGNATGGSLLVSEDEARIYRNFIQGGGPRAIGVGYPNGLNLAYDANNLRIAMVWRGDFMDAGRHWNGRGQGFQPPAGEAMATGAPGVPFAVVAASDQPWPATYQRKDNEQQPALEGGYVFKGYRLGGEARIPSFRYTFRGLAIEDSPVPTGSGESADAGFARSLTLSGPAVEHLYFRAAVAASIDADGKGGYLIGDQLVMKIESAAKPLLRTSKGQMELLVPVKFGGGPTTIKQSVTWQ